MSENEFWVRINCILCTTFLIFLLLVGNCENEKAKNMVECLKSGTPTLDCKVLLDEAYK